MLLFLVQNDEAQIFTGCKHGAAGAYNDPRSSLPNPFPLVIALRIREAGVEHRHLLPEPGSHQPQQLGRQGDFRNQKHGAFPLLQAGLNQPDIHAGFSGAGNAVEKSRPRLFLRHLGSQTFKAGLLLLIQHQRARELRRANLPAAKHRSLGQGQIAQLFQPVYRSRGGPGEIAHILHRRTADAAQQFQHLPLHGGRFGTAGGISHGLLRGLDKGGNFFRLILGFPQKIRLAGDPLLLTKVAEHLPQSVLVGDEIPQSFLLGSAAQVFQQLQKLCRSLLADSLVLPAPILRQRDGEPGSEPESRRKHYPNGIEKGTEIPLPEEGRQPQLGLGKDRAVVQAAFHRLQLVLTARLHSQDNSLRAPVGATEGNHHPLTGGKGHILGNPIGIGLVNGKIRRGNSNFSDHRPNSSTIRTGISTYTRP